MSIVYRTTGAWGPGKGANLAPQEVDNNFWELVQDVAAKAVQGVGIANILVTGDQMTVVLDDHTLLGPYTLPTVQFRFRGTWTPSTQYFTNDILTYNGSTYIVLVNHTSGTTFDPGANDGLGNNYYGLLLQNAQGLPGGGATGAFLRKMTGADYAVSWATAALSTDLSDVLVTSPANDHVLTYELGQWKNLPIPQDALANLADVSLTGLSDGQLLTYVQSAGLWENKAARTWTLEELTDVAVTAPLPGQPLVYDGTNWTDVSTVDMPCGGLNSVAGALTINRAAGEVQRFNLAGTVTATTITGWPSGGRFARIVLEIQNSGASGFAWPSNVKWPGGTIPTVSAPGSDIFILITFDGGSTIYGNVVGQAYA